MVKGMASLVNELVLEHKGTFESKRVNNIYEYGVYGKTVKHRLYAGDKKERYFHLYHSISKESAERAGIENRLNQMTLYLKKYQNKANLLIAISKSFVQHELKLRYRSNFRDISHKIMVPGYVYHMQPHS